jgi:hypothetical protein
MAAPGNRNMLLTMHICHRSVILENRLQIGLYKEVYVGMLLGTPLESKEKAWASSKRQISV